MAASMYIHVIKSTPEDDDAIKCFFSNHLGSPYWDPEHDCSIDGKEICKFHFEFMANNEAMYVGEVSWLKANLLDDHDNTYPRRATGLRSSSPSPPR